MGESWSSSFPKPLSVFHLSHHKVQSISKVRTTQNGQHTTCRVFCDLYQPLKLIPVREVIKLLKLIKAETNTPGHYKQGLSGHILKNVIFLRQIKDFYLSRSSEWYGDWKPQTCTFCKTSFPHLMATEDFKRCEEKTKWKLISNSVPLLIKQRKCKLKVAYLYQNMVK